LWDNQTEVRILINSAIHSDFSRLQVNINYEFRPEQLDTLLLATSIPQSSLSVTTSQSC
jgi:hypothetical protein